MGDIAYYFTEFQRAWIMYTGAILLFVGCLGMAVSMYRDVSKISIEEEVWEREDDDRKILGRSPRQRR